MAKALTTRELLAFVHIEKAAGTTLIHQLRLNFFLRHCDVAPLSIESNKIFRAEDMRVFLKINPAVMSIAGHAVQPISDLETLVPNIRYITILRDPIKRFVSQYQYWVEKLDRNLSFEEFLNHEDAINWQTKKMAGCEDINLAKSVLSNKFFLVGIVEEFDEFLILLTKKLKPFKFRPGYKLQNVGGKTSLIRKDMSNYLDKYSDMIFQRNALDLELYEYVKNTIIPQEKVAYGSGLEHDVDMFRQASKGYFLNFLRYIEYLYRKAYIHPIVANIRRQHGLPGKGSY